MDDRPIGRAVRAGKHYDILAIDHDCGMLLVQDQDGESDWMSPAEFDHLEMEVE